MNVGIDSARRNDFSFAGKHFGPRADNHSGRHAAHHVGIAGFADSRDAAVANPDVRFVNPHVIHDQRVRNHQVEYPVRGHGRGGLPHAVADHLAAAELGLLSGDGQILFDFNEQVGVGEAHAVARGRPVEVGVLTAWNFQTHACVAF